MDFYFDILPIYTLDGYLLNINSIPDEQKFSNEKFDLNIIDTEKFLNCRIDNNSSHIIISNIINSNNPTINIIVDDYNFTKFQLLINYMYKFGNFHNTSKIKSLNVSDLNILYSMLDSHDIKSYENYINQTIIDKLNKTTITNSPANKKFQLKHHIQFCCVHIVKNNINIVKKITISPDFLTEIESKEFVDSTNMLKKYLKYKKKYLELKSKIKIK
jgi:hypothetical protein